MKIYNSEYPYLSLVFYFQLTIREWKALFKRDDLAPAHPGDNRLRDGSMDDYIDRLEREALKFVGLTETNDSTIPAVLRLLESRKSENSIIQSKPSGNTASIIREMFDAGKSDLQIGNRLGVGESMAKQYRLKLRLLRRRPPGNGQ